MANYYVDDNKTIYAYESVKDLGIAAGSSSTVTLGLDDLTDLTGQSTIIVNRIHFHVTAYLDLVTAPDQIGYFVALGGIAPAGFIAGGGALGAASDYQEVKGWPLKGVLRYGVAKMDTAVPVGLPPQQTVLSKASISKTWTPSRKNALAINRGQEIVFNCKTISQEFNYFASIVLEARRGG